MPRRLKPLFVFKLMVVSSIFMLISLAIFVSFEDDRNPLVDKICKIPELDPWDDSVLKYLPADSGKLECPKAYNILFINDSGFIVYNQTAMEYYSLSKRSIKCKYQIVERILGDKEVKLGPKVRFSPSVFINASIFRVSCSRNKHLVYDYVHFNPFWIENESREKKIGVEDDDHYSVLLIGIDSVSRSHALRNLPKSYKYLSETLGAYDFKGYMKVGSNTFPNLIPLLTGMRHGKFPLVLNRISYCDSLPLLWNEKALKHYATLYSEDRADISTFNFVKPGFYQPPTDVYYRPYNMAMDLFTPVLMKPISTNGKLCPWDCPCYANKDNFTLQVNHFKGYLNRYKNKLKFAFFWGNAAHESFSLLRQSDDTLMEFLRWMHDNGHTKNAIIAVISDHGLRLGDFSATHIGRLEGHFPFLSLVVPEKLKQKYPWMRENLLLNSNRITTHFDVHKTIVDIAKGDFDNVSPPLDNSHVVRNILARIPRERTCSDAGILPNFCTCFSDNKILPTDDTLVKSLAVYAVSRLNSILANQSNICRSLSYYNVTEARVQYTCLNAESYKGKKHPGILDSFRKYSLGFDTEECGKSGRYKLLFHALPSKGLFEVMVEYNEQIEGHEENQMSLVGDVARLDRYGEQSHCIKENALLRQYCYCKDLG